MGVAFSPLATSGLLQLAGPPLAFTTALPWAFVTAFSLLDLLALLLSLKTWAVFYDVSSDIDEMLMTDNQRTRISQFILSRQRGWVQWLSVLAGVAGGELFLGTVSSNISSRLEIRPGSFIAVAVTAAIASNGLYWIETAAELVIRLTSIRPLKVRWYAPADTPALAKISDGIWLGTLFFAIPSAFSEGLALLVPRRSQSSVLEGFLIGLPVLAVIVAFVFTGLAHIFISVLVRQSKRSSLARIGEQIGRLEELEADASTVKSLLDVYASIRTSPILPFSAGTFVPYTAALIAPLLTFLLASSRK